MTKSAPTKRWSLPAWSDPVNEEDLIARRREIHRVPETAWTEFLATARAAELLSGYGFKVYLGSEVIHPEFIRARNVQEVEHSLERVREVGVSASVLRRMNGLSGCVAEFDTGKPGRTVAIRVELDALPIAEPKGDEHVPFREGFASVRDGIMHCCGHDGHQAVALELARWIVSNKERLTGRIKLIFQPAEEGSRGARPLAHSGRLDDVDVILCAHLACDVQGGTVVAAPERFLCTTKIDFFFDGRTSHAGMLPELGRNALLAGANAAVNIMALPRHSEGATRVNVGTLHAGEGRNVVASSATMQVEVRGENEAINQALAQEAILRAEGCAMAFGCQLRHEIMGEAVDFVPDDSITQMITVCAKRARNCEQVIPHLNYNGSDDATILMRYVQSRGGKAGYFMVGASFEGADHHGAIDFDEKYLMTLYDTFTGLLVGLCGVWEDDA